jgi:SAM-dependent methyltransferase
VRNAAPPVACEACGSTRTVPVLDPRAGVATATACIAVGCEECGRVGGHPGVRAQDATRVTCAVCGGTRTAALQYPSDESPWKKLVLAGCRDCGFSSMPAVPFSLDEYYAAEYGDRRRSNMPPPAEFFTGPPASPAVGRQRRRVERHLELLRRFGAEPGVVLDMGCGPGIFLHAVPATRKLAVEPDPRSRAYLDHIGAEVCTIDDVRDHSVDVVVTSHFIEHLLAPQLAGMVAAFKRVLKPSGVLLTEVPQGSLMSHALTNTNHAPHTSFFSPESLERVFANAGFDVLFLDTMGGKAAPALPDPLYEPAGDKPVHRSGRGSLTIVCRPLP